MHLRLHENNIDMHIRILLGLLFLELFSNLFCQWKTEFILEKKLCDFLICIEDLPMLHGDISYWYWLNQTILIEYFQIKGLKDELDEEKSKREHKTSSVPQMNGPEMQLYEVQSMLDTVYPVFLFTCHKICKNWVNLYSFLLKLFF